MRLRGIVLVVGLAGCDSLFNLDPIDPWTPRLDALDSNDEGDVLVPKDCSGVTFPRTLPIEATELMGEIAGDPWMRNDGLELFFVRLNTDPYEIWRATRASLQDPWVLDLARQSFNVAGVTNQDPSMTLDGSTLVFVVNRQTAYITTRTAGDTWLTPAKVPGLSATVITSAQISYDGLRLYFTSSNDDLMEATRASVDAPFGSPVTLLGSSTTFPTVSSDGREAYFDWLPGGIGRAARMNTSTMFAASAQEISFGKDPQLTADSTGLVISYDTTVAVLQRTCP